METLEGLSTEQLMGIIERVYNVHEMDLEHYASKSNPSESEVVIGRIHKTRLERINGYIKSSKKRNL